MRKSTVKKDREAKEIQDYTGRIIIKVDVNPDEQIKARHWIQYSDHPSYTATPNLSKKDGIFKKRNDSEALKTINTFGQKQAPTATNDLVKQKLQLMKLVLKNEKQANELMKRQINNLSTEIHVNNPTVSDIARLRHWNQLPIF